MTLRKRINDSKAGPLIKDQSIMVHVLLLTAIVATSLLAFTGSRVVFSAVLGYAMLLIAMEDARRFIVPDALSLPAIPIGLVAAGAYAPTGVEPLTVLAHLAAAVFAATALYAVRFGYQRLRNREGLGLGDVKLAAVAGTWTGPDWLSLCLLFACAAALTYVLARSLVGEQTMSRTTAIPFGTFFAPAIWLAWALSQFAAT
ncbi:MAG: prepilin peptidase [Hyphomicrobiaceae bacterium]